MISGDPQTHRTRLNIRILTVTAEKESYKLDPGMNPSGPARSRMLGDISEGSAGRDQRHACINLSRERKHRRVRDESDRSCSSETGTRQPTNQSAGICRRRSFPGLEVVRRPEESRQSSPGVRTSEVQFAPALQS